jgi:hypothetical protein
MVNELAISPLTRTGCDGSAGDKGNQDDRPWWANFVSLEPVCE